MLIFPPFFCCLFFQSGFFFSIYCIQVFHQFELIFVYGKKIKFHCFPSENSIHLTLFVVQTTVFCFLIIIYLQFDQRSFGFMYFHLFLKHQICSIGLRLFSYQYHNELVYGVPYFHFESGKYVSVLFPSDSGFFQSETLFRFM